MNNVELASLLQTLENNILKDSPFNYLFQWGLKENISLFAEYQSSSGLDRILTRLKIVGISFLILITNPILVSFAGFYGVQIARSIDRSKPLFGLRAEDLKSLGSFLNSTDLKRLLNDDIIKDSIPKIAKAFQVPENQLEILAELFIGGNLDNSLGMMNEVLQFLSDEANFKHLEDLLAIYKKKDLTPQEEKKKSDLLSYFMRKAPEILKTINNSHISGKGKLGNLIGTILKSGISKTSEVEQIEFLVKALNGLKLNFVIDNFVPDIASFAAENLENLLLLQPFVSKRPFTESELKEKQRKLARLDQINKVPEDQQETRAQEKLEIQAFLNVELTKEDEQLRNNLIKSLLPALSDLMSKLNDDLSAPGKEQFAAFVKSALEIFTPKLDNNLKKLIHNLLHDGKLTLVVGKLLPKILTFAHANFDALIAKDAVALTAPLSSLIVDIFKELDAQEGKDFIAFLKVNKAFLGKFLHTTMTKDKLEDTKDYRVLMDDSVFDFLLPAVIKSINTFDRKSKELEGALSYGLDIAFGAKRKPQKGIPAELLPIVKAVFTQSTNIQAFLAKTPEILDNFDKNAMNTDINPESLLDNKLLDVINIFFKDYALEIDEDGDVFGEENDGKSLLDLVSDGIIANNLHAKLAVAAEKFGTEGALSGAAAIFDELRKAAAFNDILIETPELATNITEAIKYFALKYQGDTLKSMNFDVRILDIIKPLLLNTQVTFDLLNALKELASFNMLRKREPMYLHEKLTPFFQALKDAFSSPDIAQTFNTDYRNAIKGFIEASPSLRMLVNYFVSSYNLTLDDIFNLISNPKELDNIIYALDEIKDLDSFDLWLVPRIGAILQEASQLSITGKIIRGMRYGPDVRQNSTLTNSLSEIFEASLKAARENNTTLRDEAPSFILEKDSDYVKEAVKYSDYSYSSFDNYVSISNMQFDNIYMPYSKFESLYINKSTLYNNSFGNIECQNYLSIKNSELRFVYLAGIKAPLDKIVIENSLFDSDSFNNLMDSVKGLNVDSRRYVNPSRYLPESLGGYSVKAQMLKIKDLSLEFNQRINKGKPVSFKDFMDKYNADIDPNTNIKLIRFKDLDFVAIELSRFEDILIGEFALENCTISEEQLKDLKKFCTSKKIVLSITQRFNGIAFDKIDWDTFKNSTHVLFENAKFSALEEETIKSSAQQHGIKLEIQKSYEKNEVAIPKAGVASDHTVKAPVKAIVEPHVGEAAHEVEPAIIIQGSQSIAEPVVSQAKSHDEKIAEPKTKTNTDFMLDGLRAAILARALDRIPLGKRSPELNRAIGESLVNTLNKDFTEWSKSEHSSKIEVAFSAYFQNKIPDKQKIASDYLSDVLNNICTVYSDMVPKILNLEGNDPINRLDIELKKAFDTVGKKSVIVQVPDPCNQRKI
ncbi:MAG: hypothetical protein LW826_07035 [Candidatus Jidaibacter sp.]|jgi:hypothetical protein|nr:hypothetical protein [Candidatus Jidaibacter sp.]